MRSRYSAYVMRDEQYLHRTWHISTRPSRASLRHLPHVHWISLEIVSTEKGGEKDEKGLVEFIASYEDNGIQQMHETSRFVAEAGKWFYIDGIIS